MDLGGEMTEIEKDFVDVRINAKDGFAVAMENNVFTILDTTIYAGAGRRRSGQRTDLQGTADA